MKIENTILPFVNATRAHAQKGDGLMPPVPSQGARTARQAINLQPGSELKLGNINGKPFDFRLFEDGGFEWSGALRLVDRPVPETRVSAQDKAAAAAMDRYSEDEWRHGSGIAGVVFNLYEVARGRLSPEALNESLQREPFHPEYLQEALSRLDIDTREPFEINGSSYALRQGKLFQVVDERA